MSWDFEFDSDDVFGDCFSDADAWMQDSDDDRTDTVWKQITIDLRGPAVPDYILNFDKTSLDATEQDLLKYVIEFKYMRPNAAQKTELQGWCDRMLDARADTFIKVVYFNKDTYQRAMHFALTYKPSLFARIGTPAGEDLEILRRYYSN